MRNAKLKKLLASFVSLCMVLAFVPGAALAAEKDDEALTRWVDASVVDEDAAKQSEAAMTRGELADLLAKLMGDEEAAEALLDNGDDEAKPEDTVTWQEAVKMICSVLGIAQDADEAVAALVERGVLDSENTDLAGDITLSAVAGVLDQLISHYVTEDTEITGEVDGFVVIAADVKVTVKDATLAEKLIVASGAKDADVELTGETSVPDVVVSASDAKVTVKNGTVVVTITVEGGNASVDVSGKVNNLKANGDNAKIKMTGAADVQNVVVSAPNATVTVANDASVSNITVEAGADEAKVDISGSVGTVNLVGSKSSVTAKDSAKVGSVSNSGDDNSITAEDNASIDSIETSGNNADITANGDSEIKDVVTSGNGSTSVSGSGTVGNVTATGSNNTDVTTGGTNVENKGDGNVTAGGENVPSGGTVTTPENPAPTPTPTPDPDPEPDVPEDNTGDNTCGDGTTTTGPGSDDNTGDHTCGAGTTTNSAGTYTTT